MSGDNKQDDMTSQNETDAADGTKKDVNGAEMGANGIVHVKSAIPKHREELLKWNGWGYKDSKFVFENNCVSFTGDRYPIGGKKLPLLMEWVKSVFDINLTDDTTKTRDLPTENNYPSPKLKGEDLQKIDSLNIPYSTKGIDRLVRAHGHTLHDIYTLRNSFFKRIPDIVVWPNNHDDVVELVRLANSHDFVIIPFGGGTAVSGAVECPENETRTIVSLDTSQMNRILWIDKENLVACCESGIIGQDLERELKKRGYTTGHEPDSYEFSSLGGWVATRASGMKKNVYGNIEDLLVHVKMVTAKGVLSKNCQVPRMSCGPDFNHVVLGSEGSLGVITEVIIKIRPLPPCKKYASVIFPDYESGIMCMREVARQRCQPASIRLMDNEQFKFGHSFKPQSGFLEQIFDGVKKVYITKIRQFDVDKMCVMTLLFEDEESAVKEHEKKIYRIAAKSGGLAAGESNGERGYILTFVIAYIRDLALSYHIVCESFETSVPWDRAIALIRNVKHCVNQQCAHHNIKHHMICSRVTQTYDAGCVVYFYFAFNYINIENPVEVYEKIEEKARDEIVASGGSISHHHGIGKLRKKWYPDTVSKVGVQLYHAVKKELDPNNIFATGNLIQSKL